MINSLDKHAPEKSKYLKANHSKLMKINLIKANICFNVSNILKRCLKEQTDEYFAIFVCKNFNEVSGNDIACNTIF